MPGELLGHPRPRQPGAPGARAAAPVSRRVRLDRPTLLGRIAAHSLHARVDSTHHTKNARTAFWVDPDRVLSPRARTRRAAHARKVYFPKLALASAKVRRQEGGG